MTAEAAGEALVVVHTPPGEANRVGIALDRLAWPEIVGTIAGDDTIFLAVSNQAAQRQVLRRLREIAAPPRQAAAARIAVIRKQETGGPVRSRPLRANGCPAELQ